MTMRNSYLFFCFILTLVSCNRDETPYIIESDDIKMTVPGFVEEEELTEEGAIEYANRFRNFYIVALKPSETNYDSLINSSLKRIENSLESYTLDTLKSDSTDNSFLIKGNFKDEKQPIYYMIRVVKIAGKNHAITVWTRGDERYKLYKQTMISILESAEKK